MSNEPKTDEQLREAKYKEYCDSVAETYSNNIALLDNRLLTLSAALLGISLTFISDLVTLDVAVYLPMLIVSWLLAGTAIFVELFGLRHATNLKNDEEKKRGARLALGLGEYAGKGDREAGNKLIDAVRMRIDSFNKWAFWLFLLALTSQVLFISINIMKQSKL